MPLRLLHLEDDPQDRELVADILRREHIDCVIVAADSRESFERGLASQPDLILCDYSLPGFDGNRAHQVARAACPGVPFIFVSGSIGEERAVEQLKNGATDYVLKDRLAKLPSAVVRALREAQEQRRRATAEADLRRLNTELETRVEQRTSELLATNRELQQARLEAERANRAKSEFLSRMSHDLRTPLNAIMGFAQVLQLDPLSAEQQDSIEQILRGGDHLLNLINEVLDIARIESGHLTLSSEALSLSEVVEHAAALVQPLAARRGISLTLELGAGVRAFADRQRLNQILLNLLSNAVKYNRADGRVTVRTAHGEGDHVTLDVVDTGPGIPADKLALLFTPFERLGAERLGIEGTGLGLALARRLAEAMHGTLVLRSTVDVGTTASITLPEADAGLPSEPDAARVPMARTDHAGTILYVEDNLSNVQLMERLLTRRPGVVLRHAADGRSALQMIDEALPDFVILDLHLPDMPGEEALRQIVAQPRLRSMPVAVLSADATRDSQQRLLAAGATAYLTKPFAIADILNLLDEALARRDRRG